MKLILFSIIAVGAAFALLYFAVRSAQRRLPPIALPAGEKMPATGLLLAALVVFAIYLGRVWRWTARDDGTLDERDRAILGLRAGIVIGYRRS